MKNRISSLITAFRTAGRRAADRLAERLTVDRAAPDLLRRQLITGIVAAPIMPAANAVSTLGAPLETAIEAAGALAEAAEAPVKLARLAVNFFDNTKLVSAASGLRLDLPVQDICAQLEQHPLFGQSFVATLTRAGGSIKKISPGLELSEITRSQMSNARLAVTEFVPFLPNAHEHYLEGAAHLRQQGFATLADVRAAFIEKAPAYCRYFLDNPHLLDCKKPSETAAIWERLANMAKEMGEEHAGLRYRLQNMKEKRERQQRGGDRWQKTRRAEIRKHGSVRRGVQKEGPPIYDIRVPKWFFNRYESLTRADLHNLSLSLRLSSNAPEEKLKNLSAYKPSDIIEIEPKKKNGKSQQRYWGEEEPSENEYQYIWTVTTADSVLIQYLDACIDGEKKLRLLSRHSANRRPVSFPRPKVKQTAQAMAGMIRRPPPSPTRPSGTFP